MALEIEAAEQDLLETETCQTEGRYCLKESDRMLTYRYFSCRIPSFN
jgi:hypothetical protein